MAGAIAQPKNELVDVADVLAKIVPLFIGSEKKSSETTQSTIDPSIMAQGNDLLSQLMARGNSTAQADGVVQDILYRAQLAFAPVLGEEKGAGLYNSSTKRLLGNEAIARATSASAEAVMKSQSDALAQATALVNARTNATRSTATSGTNKTPAAINPMLALGALGSSFLMNQLKKKDEKKTPTVPPGTSSVLDKLTGEEQPELLNSFFGNDVTGQAVSAGDVQAGTEAAANAGEVSQISDLSTIDLANGITETGAYNLSDLTAQLTSDAATVSTADLGAEALTDVGAGAAGIGAEGLIDAGGLGFEGLSYGAEAGLDVGADLAVGAAADYAVPVLGALDAISGGELLGGFLDTGYICSELHRQNRVSIMYKARVYSKFMKVLSPMTILGYRYWSQYYIPLMQRSELATKFGKVFVAAWLDQVSGKPSMFGRFIHYVIRPFSFCLGHFVREEEINGAKQFS